MKVTGIIAEYNPFHNGHKLHMEKARRLTGADFVIVVMSGDYVQRGEPAVMDKYLRTGMALESGADLVLELPLPYAAASAEFFAAGAVSLLHRLNVVDFLCFGSECGDASLLKDAAAYLADEPWEYKKALQKFLTQGLSFPSAQEAALCGCCGKEIAALLSSPNNRLGVEYCKALLHLSSPIVPISIQREGSGYHDETLCENSHMPSSASALRKEIRSSVLFPDSILSRIPSQAAVLFQKEWNISYPVLETDFSLLLHYKLLNETKESLETYLDVTPDLADKILKYLPRFTSFEAFCLLLKSKELTYSRISRCLLHILLNIKTADLEKAKMLGMTPYARILGFRKSARPLLHEIKKQSSIPLISKLANAQKILEPGAYEMLQKEILASHIYESVKAQKFSEECSPARNEFTREILIL